MPSVSVIVPCYNEQATIRLLLEALHAQTFPRTDMEVIIADGLSTDGTRAEIASFQQGYTDLVVRVVDNPRRTIPAALNCAIAAARGEFVVRLDAHSQPRPDYVCRCVTLLQAGRGDNVGGVWEIVPGRPGWVARAIAVAAAHRLGVGDARYRYTEQAEAVDTVPFGAFRRSLVGKIGPFNENLLTNEDYEFNTRIRQAGGVVWLDPAIRSTYFARGTFTGLARQYWRYGYWKARMLRLFPGTLRWRQALPPLFVLSLLLLGLLAIGLPFFRWLLAIEIGLYLLILVLVGIQVAVQEKDGTLLFGFPLAVAIMHLSWGLAFLWSWLR